MDILELSCIQCILYAACAEQAVKVIAEGIQQPLTHCVEHLQQHAPAGCLLKLLLLLLGGGCRQKRSTQLEHPNAEQPKTLYLPHDCARSLREQEKQWLRYMHPRCMAVAHLMLHTHVKCTMGRRERLCLLPVLDLTVVSTPGSHV